MKKLILACSVIAAWGCSSTDSAPPEATAGPDAFELKGSRIIGCCCPAPCPCRLNKKPYHCHGCDHTDAVFIDSGHIGGVKMDGFSYVFVGRGFGEDIDKNWVYVYVTDKTTDAQMKAFLKMLDGNVKAMGRKAPYLAGKLVGMRKVPIKYTVSPNRDEYSVVIPDILELRTRAIVNPGQSKPVVSTGIMDAFGDKFVHADCVSHKYKDASINYEWDLTGRQSNFADFVLNNERVAQGGIGWGCWTSHVDFGDRDKYQEQYKDEHK